MKIGLTGTIGSGKSTVINYITSKGYSVFDCDKYAHELLTKQSVIDSVSKHFDCLEDGVISRKKLGAIVFSDKAKLEILNSIIHPLIKQKVKELEEPVIVDMPLLFEANMEEMFDTIITVSASRDVIVERLIKRDGMTREEALHRISLQIDEKIKKKKSDYVIINDRTKQCLYKEIDKVLGGLRC